MRVANCSVLIPEGREVECGYVHMVHGTQYTIKLGNHWYDRRCDVVVNVDGKDVGTFRLNASNSLALERPTSDMGRFTFFKADSQEASKAGVDGIAKDQRGLIQVTFKPEKKVEYRIQYSSTSSLCSSEEESKTCGSILPQNASVGTSRGMSAGITGLTGKSSQMFYNVPSLDYDMANETVISIRLVADANVEVRPLPSVPHANVVPSAVE